MNKYMNKQGENSKLHQQKPTRYTKIVPLQNDGQSKMERERRKKNRKIATERNQCREKPSVQVIKGESAITREAP